VSFLVRGPNLPIPCSVEMHCLCWPLEWRTSVLPSIKECHCLRTFLLKHAAVVCEGHYSLHVMCHIAGISHVLPVTCPQILPRADTPSSSSASSITCLNTFMKLRQILCRQESGYFCRYSDGLDGRGSIRGTANNFLLHSVQTDSAAHPVFYPMGTGGSFTGVKRQRREAEHSLPSRAEVKNGRAVLHSPICRHGIVLS
jgi:hypothetical protein